MSVSRSRQLCKSCCALKEYDCLGSGWLICGNGGGAGHWIATGGDTEGIAQPVKLSESIASVSAKASFTGFCIILGFQLLVALLSGSTLVVRLQLSGGFGDGQPVRVEVGPHDSFAGLVDSEVRERQGGGDCERSPDAPVQQERHHSTPSAALALAQSI